MRLMKVRILVSFLLILFSVDDLNAQSLEWVSTYSFGHRNQAYAVESCGDNTFIIASTTFNYIDREAGITEAIASIQRISDAGDLLWHLRIGEIETERTVARDVARISEDQFIVVGDRSALEPSGNGYTDRTIWLASFTSGGELLWEKELGAGVLTKIVPEPSGGATAAGQIEVSGGKAVYFVRIDRDGEVLSEETITATIGEWVYSMFRTEYGEYVLAIGGAYLVKLDSQWQILWERRVALDEYASILALFETPDGDYLGAGISSSGLDLGSAYIVKMDSSGAVEWERVIPPKTPEDGRWFKAVTESQHGTYVAAGAECILRDVCPNLYFGVFDKEGAQRSGLHVYSSNRESVSDILAMADGGILTVGERYYTDSSSPRADSSDVYAAKIGLAEFTSFEDRTRPPPSRVLSVYPNPSSGSLSVDLPLGGPAVSRLAIHDAVGKVVYTIGDLNNASAAGKTTIDVRHLVPGVYWLVTQTGNTYHSVSFVKL